jgi:hypothetical protein
LNFGKRRSEFKENKFGEFEERCCDGLGSFGWDKKQMPCTHSKLPPTSDSAESDIELGTTATLGTTVAQSLGSNSIAQTEQRGRALSGGGLKISRRVSDIMSSETGNKGATLREDRKEEFVDAFHPILRGFMLNFCVLEAAFVVIPAALVDIDSQMIHEQAQHNMTLSAFAAWPLVGLFIGAASFSDFHDDRTPRFPLVESLCFLLGGLFPWSFSGIFGFDMWLEGSTFIKVMIQIFVFAVVVVFYVFCVAMKFRCQKLSPERKVKKALGGGGGEAMTREYLYIIIIIYTMTILTSLSILHSMRSSQIVLAP